MNRNSFIPNRKGQFNTTQRSIPNNATHRTPNSWYEQPVTDTQSQENIVENSFSKKSKTGQDDSTEKCSAGVSTTDLQFVEQENGNIEEVNKNNILSTLSLGTWGSYDLRPVKIVLTLIGQKDSLYIDQHWCSWC